MSETSTGRRGRPGLADVRVYLAGKIGKHDWRHELFPGLHGAAGYEEVEQWARNPSWAVPDHARAAVARTPASVHGRTRYVYAGPYFLACDHGCAHGRSTHGQRGLPGGCPDAWAGDAARAHESPLAPAEVAARCLGWLRGSDVVFVWLDSVTAYGTLAEIGYARGIGLPVYGYTDARREDELEDLWLALELCTVRGAAPSPYLAWGRFLQDLGDDPVRRLGVGSRPRHGGAWRDG